MGEGYLNSLEIDELDITFVQVQELSVAFFVTKLDQVWNKLPNKDILQHISTLIITVPAPTIQRKGLSLINSGLTQGPW